MALSDRDRALVLETFLAEAADHLRGLEEKLVALEARSTDADLLQEIFRSVHSLKGDAAMVGFPHVADFAHEVEDLLDALRTGEADVRAETISLLLRAVEAEPDRAYPYSFLGRFLQQQGQLAAAQTAYERALACRR